MGDHIIVRGHPGRDPDRKIALLRSLEKDDVSLLDDYAPSAASVRASSLAGAWATPDGVLVVETAQFSDHPFGNSPRGLPSGAEKHVVERFRLNPDGLALTYEFTLEDAEYFLSAHSDSVQWLYQGDAELDTGECGLDSARRVLGN